MFFLALAAFGVSAWFLPWWMMIVVSVMLGLILPGGWRLTLKAALAAALASDAVAFVLDGRSYGVIAKRMSGVFGLPPWGIFLVLALLALVTTILGYRTGAGFSRKRRIL